MRERELRLVSLEEKVRPKLTVGEAPWLRDVFGAALVIALTVTLLSAWQVNQQRYFKDVVGQMFSFYLLPALGFCLALRCGAIDLSVWSVSAVGGAVAVAVLRVGGGVVSAFQAAAVAGALLGAVHGLLVGRLRLPSVVVTLATSVIILLVLEAVCQGRVVVAPAGTLDVWLEQIGLPPFAVRIFLVTLTYVATMIVLSVLCSAATLGRMGLHPRLTLFGSLCGSGILAALGGAIWLVDRGSSPVPGRVIGDLRIPAAAILAGGAFFTGRGRVLLAVLCLPATILAATIWRLQVVHLPFHGYCLQMVLLVGMTIVTHLAVLHAIARRRAHPALCVAAIALTLAGELLFACAAKAEGRLGRELFHISGLAGWTIGAVLLVVSRVLSRRRTVAATT